MATVSDKTQHSYADADEFIQYQLEKVRRRIKATDLLTAGVLAGLLLVGYVLTFTLLDHWVIDGGFGAWTRAILLAVILVLCGAILIRYVLRPWFRRIHPLYAARMLDRSSEELQGSLLALVDLQAAGYKSDGAIHRTLEKRVAVTLADVHVDEAIDRRLLTRMGTGLFIITLITCLYAVLSPKSISLLRPLTFAGTSVATRTVIEAVQPGNTIIPAGSQLEFVADLAGVIPNEIRVLYSTSDQRFVDEPLTMRTTDDEHRFRILMVGDGDRGIRQDMTYRVEAGDATSEIYSITVEQPPTARVTEVHYVYPDYMDLPERTDFSGAIEAWEDTTLTVLAESSEPVSDAVLQMSDDAAFSVRGEELQMAIDGTQLSVNWKLTHRDDNTFPKFYRIQVTDPEGQKDPEPAVYPVDVRRDQPPVLKLIDPVRDLQVAANAIVPLLVEAEDPDFLLRDVKLHYAVNGKLIQPSEVLLDEFKKRLTKRWTGTWDFRLKPLNLNPGDVVKFHLEARDNRQPTANQTHTGDLNLQITAPVSEQQVQEQLAQDRQMQDQMRQPDNSNSNDAQENQGDNPASEQPQTGENTEDPTPNEAASDDPNSDQSPDEKNADGKSGQQKDPKNEDGGQKNGDEQNRDPNQPNDSTEQQPGQDGSASRQQERRADDDKALQKLIERMNRDRKDPGSDNNDDNGDSKRDSRRPRTEEKTERPERKRGEPGKENDRNENQKDQSPRAETRDSKTPNENSGEESKDEPADESTGNEKNSDDQPNDTAVNEDQREEKKPTPGVDESQDDLKNDDPDAGSKNGVDESRPDRTGETPPAVDAESIEQKQPGDSTGEKTPDDAPTEEPSGEKAPGNDSDTSGTADQQDPKNTDGASRPDQPSKNTPEKNSNDATSDPEKSDAKPEDKPGEQQGADKPGDEQNPSEPTDKPGDKPGDKPSDKPSDESGTDKPPMQNENPLNMNSKTGRQSDPNKTGNETSKESKSGGEKSGSEKSGGEKSGSEKSGGEKSGGKSSESNGNSPSESEEGGPGTGQRTIGRADPNTTGTDEQGEEGPGNGGIPDSKEPPEGSQPKEPVPAQPADPQADDAAGAAALAIKRLQQELERGNVDPKLLEELGWTESEIKSFADRLQKKLAQREVNAQQQKAKSISEKSFDAMLKGLDINSTGSTRQGRADRDRDQQDTTTRQSAPPSRYKQLVEGYQRSVSGAKDSKP